MVSVLQATAVLSQNLREKVDAISIWQDTTQQTIKELSTNLTKLPEEVSMLLSGTITAIVLLSYSKVHAYGKNKGTRMRIYVERPSERFL